MTIQIYFIADHLPNSFFRELDNVLDNLKRSTDSTLFSPDSHRPSSVVNVDSLDDSFGLPSPSERTVVAKVRTRTGMRRFTMKAVSTVQDCFLFSNRG